MFNPATHQSDRRRPNFGLTEVLLIAGIFVFGAFTLISDGSETLGTLISGVGGVLGG